MPKGIFKNPTERAKKISESCLKRKKKFGYINSPETRKKMSELIKNKWIEGKWFSPMLGKKPSKETRKNMSESHKGQIPYNKGKKYPQFSGENHPHWKGGITPINQKIRGSLEMKLWIDSVFNRDCNCCQKCGENRIRNLTSHHILNFYSHIELRFAIDNGITFCRECHKLFHKKYGRKNNTQEQLKEFLYGK